MENKPKKISKKLIIVILILALIVACAIGYSVASQNAGTVTKTSVIGCWEIDTDRGPGIDGATIYLTFAKDGTYTEETVENGQTFSTVSGSFDISDGTLYLTPDGGNSLSYPVKYDNYDLLLYTSGSDNPLYYKRSSHTTQ